MIGACLALALLELVGVLVLGLLCSEPERLGRGEQLAVSFALGLAGLTWWLFLWSLCGLTPSWSLGFAVVGCLAGATLTIGRQRFIRLVQPPVTGQARTMVRLPAEIQVGAARSWVELLLVAFIATAFGLASAVALLEPIADWDVIAIWGFKAEVLLREPAISSPYFTDLSKAYSHLDYPLLWPLALAWIWMGAGRIDLVAVKVIAPALLAAFVAAFYGRVAHRAALSSDRLPRLLFTALLVGTPMLSAQTVRLGADVPLAFFALLAFGFSYRWLESDHADDLRLAGCFTAALLFTKNEGLALSAALVLSMTAELALERKVTRLGRMLFWLVGFPAAAMLPWFAFRAGVPKVHEDYGARIALPVFVENISRIPEILAASGSYFGSITDWLFFWPLLGVTLFVGAPIWLLQRPRFLALGLGLGLSAYGYAYVVTPWNVLTLMEVSANRLLLQLFGVAGLLLAEVTEDLRDSAREGSDR